MLPRVDEGGSDLHLPDRLRTATAAAHAALEDGLALLRPPLERARFIHALQGFHAFHTAWEPRVAALLGEAAAWLASRRRLALLERDLEALGARPDPGRRFDLGFLHDRASAWGSLYVVEGSTLGGQVIAKALRRGAAWAPAEGLAYFNPHGRETAAMWRGFCERLDREAPTLRLDAVVAGAEHTFEALRIGLALPVEAAA